jgi:hypothetical protein
VVTSSWRGGCAASGPVNLRLQLANLVVLPFFASIGLAAPFHLQSDDLVGDLRRFRFMCDLDRSGNFLVDGGCASLITIASHALVVTMVVNVARAMSVKQQLHSSLVLIAVMIPTSSVLMAAHVIEVFASDPVQIGLVASLIRPGGNITGVTQSGIEVASKRLELARELLPTATRIAVLVNLTNSQHHRNHCRLKPTSVELWLVDWHCRRMH